MKILVTGGAGYIGSFMVKRLLDDWNTVTVADSLERGHKGSIDSRATVQTGDLRDKAFLERLFSSESFDAIIHFAGYIAVGESMKNAYMYFDNNVSASLNLLEEARKNKVSKIVFSSSAAVYGNPVKVPIPEDHPKSPESPYGESKLMFETVLQWYHKVHQFNSVCLRYFNACGAALDGSMGEAHEPETHIIPNAIRAAKQNQEFTLFGSDYDTPDGTCVRDYIHVLDLVEAHVLALKKLEKDSGAFAYNVGTGKGFSNKEVVEMVKKVTGKDFPVTMSDRRPGDAGTLVADPSKITQDLQFAPKHSDLETIVKSAWEWHQKSA